MLISVIFYALPSIFMIFALFSLYHRPIFINYFGDEIKSLVLMLAIVFFLFGLLGLILVISGFYDIMLFWIIGAVILIIFLIWLLHYLNQQKQIKK